QVVRAREADRDDDVGRAGALHDERRPPSVVCAVPDPCGLVVAGVVGRAHLAADRLAELLNRRLAEDRRDRSRHLRLLSLAAFEGVVPPPALPPLSGGLASSRSRSSTVAAAGASSRAA